MRPVVVWPVAETGKDRWQVLDPDWSWLQFVAQEGALIGHVEIDRSGGMRNYRVGTAEVISIGPTIVVVEETQIGGVGFGDAEIAGVAAPMPVGSRDEGEGTYARSNVPEDRSIFGLILLSGAIVDDDDLDAREGLSENRLERLPKRAWPVAGRMITEKNDIGSSSTRICFLIAAIVRPLL
jgi:hypothetical protein